MARAPTKRGCTWRGAQQQRRTFSASAATICLVSSSFFNASLIVVGIVGRPAAAAASRCYAGWQRGRAAGFRYEWRTTLIVMVKQLLCARSVALWTFAFESLQVRSERVGHPVAGVASKVAGMWRKYESYQLLLGPQRAWAVNSFDCRNQGRLAAKRYPRVLWSQ